MICTIHPTCPIGATHAAHPNCSIYPAHCSPYLHCLPTHLIGTTPLGLPHLHLLLHFCLTHLVCATKSPHSHCQPYPSYLHHLHCSLLLLCQLPIPPSPCPHLFPVISDLQSLQSARKTECLEVGCYFRWVSEFFKRSAHPPCTAPTAPPDCPTCLLLFALPIPLNLIALLASLACLPCLHCFVD